MVSNHNAVILCVGMPGVRKRKVRRKLHRPIGWMGEYGGFWAPIAGERSRKLYHFARVDIGEPLPFLSPEQAVYLRYFIN